MTKKLQIIHSFSIKINLIYKKKLIQSPLILLNQYSLENLKEIHFHIDS